MAMEFSIGGFNVKGWMVALALPVLSAVSGGVYWGYDTLNRFYGVEGGVGEALDKASANAKQILELQRSLTKLETDTASCLLYTSPSPRDQRGSRMPSSA